MDAQKRCQAPSPVSSSSVLLKYLSHYYEGESDVRVDRWVPPEPEYHSAHINALLTLIIVKAWLGGVTL